MRAARNAGESGRRAGLRSASGSRVCSKARSYDGVSLSDAGASARTSCLRSAGVHPKNWAKRRQSVGRWGVITLTGRYPVALPTPLRERGAYRPRPAPSPRSSIVRPRTRGCGSRRASRCSPTSQQLLAGRAVRNTPAAKADRASGARIVKPSSARARHAASFRTHRIHPPRRG